MKTFFSLLCICFGVLILVLVILYQRDRFNCHIGFDAAKTRGDSLLVVVDNHSCKVWLAK